MTLAAYHAEAELYMNARELIEGALYGPEMLNVLSRAFDQAWAQIAANYGSEQARIEAARRRLANAVLALANEDSRDAELLKQAALKVMARPPL
jgi:hypothetical protein